MLRIFDRVVLKGHHLIFIVMMLSLIRPSFVNALIAIMFFLLVERKNILIRKLSVVCWFSFLMLGLVSVIFGIFERLDLYILHTSVLIFFVVYYGGSMSFDKIIRLLDTLLFSYFLYGFIVVTASLLVLGPNFQYIYDVNSGGLGSKVFLSNSMALGFILYAFRFILTMQGSIKFLTHLCGVSIIFFGIMSGGRTFTIIFLLSLIPICMKLFSADKNKPRRQIILRSVVGLCCLALLSFLLPLLLSGSRLGVEGIESQRFLVWLDVMSKYDILDLNKVDLEGQYFISAFHNVVLDSFLIYGRVALILLLPSLLLFITIAFRSLKLNSSSYLRLHIINTLILALTLLATTVVPRGDVMPIFVTLALVYFLCKLPKNELKF